MADTLFYADAVPAVGQIAVVEGDEGFHAATVRRIRPGERLVLSDGAGALARCEVREAGKRGLSAQVVERWTAPRPLPPVTVVQAIPKSERSELAIELATEAGADDFLRLAGRPVRRALGRRPRARRVYGAGVRWPARRPGSRGGPTSPTSAGRCRRMRWQG